MRGGGDTWGVRTEKSESVINIISTLFPAARIKPYISKGSETERFWYTLGFEGHKEAVAEMCGWYACLCSKFERLVWLRQYRI